MRDSVASASAITSSPPITRLSLLASARSMPSVRATIVGPRPAAPTTAFRTRSGLDSAISCRTPSSPARTCPPHASEARWAESASASATVGTPWSRACARTRSQLESAESPATWSPSAAPITSRACVPIDRVDPSISPRFTALSVGGARNGPKSARAAPKRRTGGPRASRSSHRAPPALADLDRRELELRDLQVTGRLVAGDGEGVLPALRSRADVHPEALDSTGRVDVGLGARELGAVDLEVADAGGRGTGAVEGAIEDDQVLAREPGRAVHVHRGALGERRRVERVTRGRARLRVGGADAEDLEAGVLAEALVLDLLAGGGVGAPSKRHA